MYAALLYYVVTGCDCDRILKSLAQDNRVDKEQYFDYVYDTQFRMALLTKQSNADKITQNETVTKGHIGRTLFPHHLRYRFGCSTGMDGYGTHRY